MLSVLFVLVFTPTAILCQAITNQGPTSAATLQSADPSEKSARSSAAAVTSDLEWLVGRWRCVTRQYFTRQEHLLAGRGEDSLDYFNVYLPYADDRLTLGLADDPGQRPIAAEFLVRYVDDTGPFKEELAPMSPGGLVRVGRDRIWYGSPPANDFEFKYSVEKRGHRLWLILESKSVRLELVKLYAGVGDIRQSFVQAAIRDYSPERVMKLAKEYEQLKRSAAQEGGSEAQQRLTPQSP